MRLRFFVGALVIAAIAAGVFHKLSGLNFWISWAIVLLAMVINGLIAEWEDHRSGGFLNPK